MIIIIIICTDGSRRARVNQTIRARPAVRVLRHILI